jgi:phage terminase large subunit-like protein
VEHTKAERDKLLALQRQFSMFLAANRIKTYKPYPWQSEFHEAGLLNAERMLMAANRVGKTLSAGAETSYHLTGEYPGPCAEYPEGWKGQRFDHPVLAWTGSPTNETSRDIVQLELLGGLGETLGTGWIPRDKIVGKPTTRQAGVKNVCEGFQVRHKSGGISTCSMKTYEMGWEKFQGTAPHWVWLDEEPSDYMIFSECQTRILTSRGRVIVTFTPLSGETELVQHFMQGNGSNGIYLKGASWDDAPHLDPVEKARLKNSYRAHEVKARTQGVPMLGEGAVFPVDEDDIRITPIQIPAHWARIKGCDFGIDHPAAGVDVCWDRDTDTIYLVDCYKKAQELAPYHAAWFKKSNPWVPVAWPHDGLNREKTGGVRIAVGYRRHGVNMLQKSARYPKNPGEEKDKGGPQPVEPIIDEMRERMNTGRFKVFSTCGPFFEEMRSYHRKNGTLSTKNDDILKALFYAVMMKRFAVTRAVSMIGHNSRGAPATSIASMR